MHGRYLCVAEDGEPFDAEIAPFLLEDGTRRVLH
jgi:ApaG protein